MLPLVCKDADKIKDKAKVKVSVKGGYLEADWKRCDTETVPEFMRGIIDAGGLVAYAKKLKEVTVCTKS